MSESRGPEDANDELARQRRLVDQLASMHSMLRDRYQRQATFSTCTLLVLSLIAVALAFATQGEQVPVLAIEFQRSTWLGWFAVVVFALSLIDLVLDRRGAAARHGDAVRQLASLKIAYRPAVETEEQASVQALSQRYTAVMNALPPIPEKKFNRLKARHLAKLEVSKYLSDNPGSPVILARWRVMRGGSR